MKNLTKLAAFAFATLVPAVALADAGGISAAARVDLVPVGTVAFSAGDIEADDDLAFAYGVSAQIDYWVTDQISVGFAPRYLMNVIGKEADDAGGDAASELDLLLRAQYNHTVNPQLQAYGFLAPGYSIIMPDSDDDDVENPAGLAIGFGAGARYGINEKLFAVGELGYQIGMQSVEVGDETADFTTSFLHIGVGIGSHF